MSMLRVLYATDTNGFALMLVSIKSLLKHNELVKVTVMCSSDTSQVYLDVLSSMDIEYILVDDGDLPPTNTSLPKVANYRLLAPEMLPDYDQMVYLDIDTLVRGDITELFEAVYLLGGVEDMGIADNYPSKSGSKYINSGVLTMNLARMRELDFTKNVLSRVKKGDLKADDQDVINLLYGSKIELKASTYNYTNPAYFKDRLYFGRNYLPNPRVVHFVGRHKPWYAICLNPWKKEWWEYYHSLPSNIRERKLVKKFFLRSIVDVYKYR